MKLLPFLFIICQAVAFMPIATVERSYPSTPHSFLSRAVSNSGLSLKPVDHDDNVVSLAATPKPTRSIQERLASSFAGFSIGAFSMVSFALAEVADEVDEVEITSLPPPYVPAIFAVLLLVGVGVLTGSLGDVMYEEASLGMQSGARAKKEMERSRSSYFKK